MSYLRRGAERSAHAGGREGAGAGPCSPPRPSAGGTRRGSPPRGRRACPWRRGPRRPRRGSAVCGREGGRREGPRGRSEFVGGGVVSGRGATAGDLRMQTATRPERAEVSPVSSPRAGRTSASRARLSSTAEPASEAAWPLSLAASVAAAKAAARADAEPDAPAEEEAPSASASAVSGLRREATRAATGEAVASRRPREATAACVEGFGATGVSAGRSPGRRRGTEDEARSGDGILRRGGAADEAGRSLGSTAKGSNRATLALERRCRLMPQRLASVMI